MADIFALNPVVASVNVVPWNQLIATQAFGIDAVLCEKNVIRDVYSANVRNLSASTMMTAFEKMGKFYAKYPTARTSALLFEVFPNQATLAYPPGSTAYPWRDSIGNLLVPPLTLHKPYFLCALSLFSVMLHSILALNVLC